MFKWDFGDGANVLLQNPQRNYNWQAAGNPHQFNVKLTVTDAVGCTIDTTEQVGIYQNQLAGNLGVAQTICASAAPLTVTYTSTGAGVPVLYQWSNAINTTTPSLNVGQSGTYWVTVFDNHQCQFTTTPTKKVTVLQTPVAQITGQQTYCYGDAVKLYGYAGSDPSITYAWTRNAVPVGTTATLNDAGLSAGVYIYRLTVSATDPLSGITCSNVSAPDTVTIYGLPAPPTINGPLVVACSSYHLQLFATGPGGPGTYTWSNGVTGVTDDIYVGGPYRLWFTDNHGCKSHNDAYVPLSPDSYFPYFPSGCYTLCKQQLPVTLYGPPGVTFAPWEWLMNGGIVSSGYGYMLPYALSGPGSYQWDLNNGLCDQKSPPLDLNIIDCSSCQVGLRPQISCSKSPAGYTLILSFTSPGAGTTYTIGTNIGPVLPFSGTLGSGFTSLTLSFTTLSIPPPATVTIEVLFTLPGGKKCYQTVTVALPACNWIPQRLTQTGSSSNEEIMSQLQVSTAMMIYPNPASDNVTVSYDYGNGKFDRHTISIYDALGRKVLSYNASDEHGNWNFSSANLASGMYIVNMEGDGRQLQTQRLTIVH